MQMIECYLFDLEEDGVCCHISFYTDLEPRKTQSTFVAGFT